ncbi:MAG: 2-dehydro-3-deoxygalactonokinase [Sulfitobacter sp.]|nr:2-dehydro-3-deoxygalactonokinase [Sulfitobacter sp.]
MRKTEWIGLTWGAEYPLVSVVGVDGKIIAQHAGPVDLAYNTLSTLAEFLAPYLSLAHPTPVFCAGLPDMPVDLLRSVPAVPMDGTFQIEVADPRLVLHVVPGLRQAKPADLMSGCETAIDGMLLQDPKFDGVVCTVASHARWSHVSAGEIVSFQSFLTPALAEALVKNLPFSGCASQGPLDEAAFGQAVEDIMARPQNFAANLAHISADAALNGAANSAGWSRLMGALIGLELSGARPYWLGQNVVVLGDGILSDLYKAALVGQGLQPQLISRDAQLLAGLRSAWAHMEGDLMSRDLPDR